MQSLRNRQIREIMDEEMNINRRVFDREKEQVRVFDEVILPKKTRDVDAEIGVDKLIENINKILENKLTSLEYLLSKITSTQDIGDAEGRRSYNNIISNGDFITSYNSLIRIYTTAGISRNSQEIIKVKFQEIKPNIDAIMYGIEELVQYLFESGKSDKEIFQLIRSQAVYQVVKNQLYRSSSYKIIEQGDIAVSIKEVLAELSEVQREELRDISERDITERSLLKLPFELGKDEERIKQLEAEMGFRLPEQQRSELSELGRSEKEQAYSMFGDLGKTISSLSRQEQDENIRQQEQRKDILIKRQKDLISGIRTAENEKLRLEAQQRQLVQGQPEFKDDEKKENDNVEVPLAGEIIEKQEQIDALRKNLKENKQALSDLKEEIRQNKALFEQAIDRRSLHPLENLLQEQFTENIGKLPLRRKKVKSLIVEPEVEEEEEEDEKEEASPAQASQQQRIPWYTKAYLQTQEVPRLRIIASSFQPPYTPQQDSSKTTIIDNIIKRQTSKFGKDRPANSVIVGLGIGGAMSLADTFKQFGENVKGQYNMVKSTLGLGRQNPMSWRGLPYRRDYMPDYGYEGYGYERNDYGYNDRRMDSMYDDRRNDIYHIQQQLKRGY